MAKSKDPLAVLNPSPELIARMLKETQRQGKVEAPKPADKPKFRPVLPRNKGRTAMPGEARELAGQEWFKMRCQQYGITPTRRQAAKYIQMRGALWNKTR